jgi:2-polyprenyl-3-methyl-5-hydroxy-6-metoxy-1,4-benzoquinol methylase
MSPLTLSRQRHGILVECLAQRAQPVATSNHFTVYGIDPVSTAAADPDDIVVVHDFEPWQIDNNIGSYVANELLPLLPEGSGAAHGYAYSKQEIFERYVGEIVRSMDGNERRAWHLFYDNTLAALQETSLGRDSAEKQDFIGDFGAIYRRVFSLAAELPHATILDVATCFGFLPLLLASRRNAAGQSLSSIVGCDLNPALVALADDYARQRQLADVCFIRADILAGDIDRELAASAPSFDVVTAIHLLEHLAPEQTGPAMNNLWRITRQRLIVAVPLEDVPDRRFGHLQGFNRDALLALGRQTGGYCRYFDHYGGWIVIDRTCDHDLQREGSDEL